MNSDNIHNFASEKLQRRIMEKVEGGVPVHFLNVHVMNYAWGRPGNQSTVAKLAGGLTDPTKTYAEVCIFFFTVNNFVPHFSFGWERTVMDQHKFQKSLRPSKITFHQIREY